MKHSSGRMTEEERAFFLLKQRLLVRKVMETYLGHPPETRAEEVQKILDGGEQALGQVNRTPASDLIRAWVPVVSCRPKPALAVPYSGQQKMSSLLYKELLRDRLQELISKNHDRAKNALEGSSEYSPDLYQIGRWNPSRDWASLIMESDQMMILLNKIDWKRTGHSLSLPQSDLENLDELLSVIY